MPEEIKTDVVTPDEETTVETEVVAPAEEAAPTTE